MGVQPVNGGRGCPNPPGCGESRWPHDLPLVTRAVNKPYAPFAEIDLTAWRPGSRNDTWPQRARGSGHGSPAEPDAAAELRGRPVHATNRAERPHPLLLEKLGDAHIVTTVGERVSRMLETSVDAETFARMAQLFATKRSLLPPSAVEALASDIVDHLARVVPGAARLDDSAIAEDSVAAFREALIDPEAAAALRFIEARRAEGVSREGVYLGYIPAAARKLGEGWDLNRLSFAEVTIGTGHLYALMRVLRAEETQQRPTFDARRCALFATVPGEDHSIGITIAADLFRNAGWEIDLQVATDHDRLIAHVDRTRPSIIGLSLTTERRLAALVRLVVALRIVAPTVLIGVAPPADLDAGTVEGLVDLDLLIRDVPGALAELDRLIRLRG